MRVLITGGCGFLGGHVVEHLLKNTDWHISIIDGLRHVGDPARLTDIECFDPARVTVHWWDLRSPIPPFLQDRIGEPDYILNLAADSHVDRSIANPGDTINNNVNIAIATLDFARIVRPKAFIQFSTDEVFGPITDQHPEPFKEWEACLPSSPYSASKACQDMIAISYWRTFGLPVVVTHAMNLYGERQNPEKIVPLAIKNHLQGRPTPVHGEQQPDGTWQAGTRYWLHARNCADALLFLLRNTTPARYPETDRPDKYNIAGDREISNLEIVERVAAALGVEPLYSWVDAHSCRPGHDRAYGLDNSKLKALGWQAPVEFEESFTKCVLWEMNKHESR